jgi:hypothetical protein
MTKYINYVLNTNYITTTTKSKTAFTQEIWWADRRADVASVACGLGVPRGCWDVCRNVSNLKISPAADFYITFHMAGEITGVRA